MTLLTLAAPICSALAGRAPLPALQQYGAASAFPAPATEDRLVLGQVAAGQFHPGTHLGSGMLRGLARATGFAVVPPGGVDANESVRWLPLPL